MAYPLEALLAPDNVEIPSYAPPWLTFTTPDVQIGAQVVEHMNTTDRRWHVSYSEKTTTYEGIGETKELAYLDLIAVRLGLGHIVQERPGA